MSLNRLQKIISESGLLSRRKADLLIKQGRVTFKDVSGSCSGSNHIVISASSYHLGDRIDGQGIVKIKTGFGAVTIASDGVGSFYIVSTS